MDLFEATQNVYYARVLLHSRDSGDDVCKVNVNKEEGIHSQRKEVHTWCKLSFPDDVVSHVTDGISAMCSLRQ